MLNLYTRLYPDFYKPLDQLCECGPKSGDLWGWEGSYQDTFPNYWTMFTLVRLYKMTCAVPWSPRKETNSGGCLTEHESSVP